MMCLNRFAAFTCDIFFPQFANIISGKEYCVKLKTVLLSLIGKTRVFGEKKNAVVADKRIKKKL